MMAMQKPVANPSVIRDHLRHIFKRWHEIDIDCVFEVRLLTADDEATVKNVARFRPSEDGITEASEHIAAMNAYGLNAYTVVNPIRADADIKAGHAAKDEHIAASFFHWADADDAQAAENIRTFVGPRPTFFVLTGQHPCPRPHVYWELTEPETDLVAWKTRQQAIAATLKSDGSVVNPSRIMRVGGTVNWPKPKKIAKGYTQEVTELHIHAAADRPLVSADRMARAFLSAPTTPQSGAGFHIDTGDVDRKSADQYADILRRARTDGEKHTGVRDLTASLAGMGVSRAMAEAIIREACPVWDDGVIKLIDTAYAKFFQPKPQPNFDHAPAPTQSDPNPAVGGWQVQTAADFTADFVAPEYIMDGVIQRGRVYTLTAPTGSGKTAVMLYAAATIATGGQFCGHEVEHGDVLFLAGENPDDVRARMIGTMEFHQIDPTACRVHFIAGTFSIRADLEKLRAEAAKLPDLKLVVIDTFAAYFDGEDENSNTQALDFARLVRRVAAFDQKPAVVMPSHPVKNATRANLTPKGGSSLLNEVDGNLTLWNDGGILSMHWQGKFRGAEFEAMQMELQRYESSMICDSQGRIIPTILAKPLGEMRAMQIATENLTQEDKTLLSIQDAPAISVRERCVTAGVLLADGRAHKSKMDRILRKLSEQKLIRKFRTNWELTKDGERAVEMLTAGQPFAKEI